MLAFLVDPQTGELSGWWKDAGFKYQRAVADTAATVYEQVTAALTTALNLREGEDFRVVVTQIAEQAAQAAVTERAEARSVESGRHSFLESILRSTEPTRASTVPPLVLAAASAASKPIARVTVEGLKAQLWLDNSPFGLNECVVTDPAGREHIKSAFTFSSASPSRLTYPDDFPRVAAQAGPHSFVWRPVQLILNAPPPSPIARGEFTLVDEAEPGEPLRDVER